MTFDDNEFLTSFRNICPKELDLKVERQGNHASFLDLDIKVEDSIFVYKPFDKRDKFSLFIVGIPHLSSNMIDKWLRRWIPNPGARVQNHWVAPRLTQPFILLRSIK